MSDYASGTEPNEKPFGVVINHFSTRDVPHLRASTMLAATLSRQDPLVREVIIVDGSPHRDEQLAHDAANLDIRYHHEGRSLSFAEGYNIGARLVVTPWLVLSASDIYPALDFYASAYALIGTAGDRIGCIIPRLSNSDLPLQESVRSPTSVCTVPLMTLNLNIFDREAFFALGGVPECYSGGYNDVEMSIRIRDSGRSIFMLPTRCNHFGRLTLASAASGYRHVEDRRMFFYRFPEFAKLGYFWDIDVAKLCTGPLRLMLRVAGSATPAGRRLDMIHRTLRLTPLLQRWRPE